ncbi:M10 family metallopeptidase C-terminal domain-containing protein [Bradyrhizobium liaoningense]|uniref:M10 family metallopeptidase C-terminal domain-containing protein n=1 Tax=Bradyrhizobium liaoningense TaxID=43992 RepID=UPI001BAC400C|nr:M10 family metallopeptidase C-terminal domain-containing protein [Bradyrhizobium liaoningense]MBR0713027.1 M10 family metallopeptidase C-terminal domain-containing protein [Bradyrhizobium liaoningense]
MATAVYASATNNAEIDGLLGGTKWSGTITYSFPDSPSDYSASYNGNGEPTGSGFAQAPSQMQSAIVYAVGLINSYTNANIQYAGTNGADIMVAQSPAANPTSYAYYPSSYASGGDIWFGTAYNYSLASLGNYYFATALHELGHAVGLKHSQETGGVSNVAVPSAHDDSEYTIMSYRSYVGAPLTGYTAESYGFSQTYMANDILALQTLYGANYSTQSGNTVYTWSPTTGQEFINGVGQLAPGGGAGGSANRIFETVWDGGGVDTYDLSNYATNLSLNLNPGAASVFSSTQIAYLGNGHYASGNVYNAYVYNNDARSYIDNAIGGSGSDTIIGNVIANVLNGGGGNDTITGGGGNDTIVGGSGTDTAVYSGSRASYAVSYNSATQVFTLIDQRSSTPDGTDTVSSIESFQFADGTISSATLISQLAPVVIEAIGDTSLVQSNGYYLLNPTAGGTGPTMKNGGAPLPVGQFSALTAIGAEQTGSGYDVAWKALNADQYTVWTTDSNGNMQLMILAAVSGTSYELESIETTFHQDLNGDGTIGVVTRVIESAGTTTLTQIANNYYLYQSGVGPTLKYNIVPVIAGQFAPYTPVAAEHTAGGYEVAWKDSSTNQFVIWDTDANGNRLSFAVYAGSSTTLESFETTFQQDLNGDGVVGVPVSAAIETYGATALVQTGNNYFLNPTAAGSGPSLKLAGVSVVAGQFSPYTPIAAEQTASGYEIAWKDAGTNQFVIWDTDANGNRLSFALYDGSSTTLESFETSFHQDLNGDGSIGVPAGSTVIEAYGTTALVQTGNNYFLNPTAGGSGPSLKLGGVAVVAGQFSPYTPIAAEQTASGYEIAWKDAGTNQFVIWDTDANGNRLSFAVYAGSSTTLESVETSFRQDLNGDGSIGVPASSTVIEAYSSTALVQSGSNYLLNPTAGGSGPSLKLGGVAVVAGQFSPYTPIGAEQTASGYEIAWKDAGANQFVIWDTDSNGNRLSFAAYAGSSTTLESVETSFHQDLNGDGVIGVPAAPPAAALGDNFVFASDSSAGGGSPDAYPVMSKDVKPGDGHLPTGEVLSFIELAGADLPHLVSYHLNDHLGDFLLR